MIFWFIGLVPDLATMRDRAKKQWQKIIFGMFGMGWRGSAKHWARYQMAYLLLGGLATPLVVSVHTVVSFDFAISLLPGWHTTIFPPYFVAGAIYSGFAMVVTLAIPARKWFHLEDLITMRHLDCMAKLMLGTGLIVAYGYAMEAFMSWYSGNPHEMFMYMNRATGPYALLLLEPDSVQYPDPPVAMVGEGPPEHSPVVLCLHRGEHRHVAGTLHHRHHQPGIATFCPLPGACIIRHSGTGRCSSAPSDSSWC